MTFSFTFEVRQIMYQIGNSLQRRRHFCFDATPYAIERRGLRRNRNVWAAASSELSHWQLESKTPNKSPEPTATASWVFCELLIQPAKFPVCILTIENA